MKKKSLCLFCGARNGNNDVYLHQAKQLGELIAKKNWKLIYGGGGIGLMGAAAISCIDHGGEAVGVIPQSLLVQEKAHPELSELIITQSMHERKKIMFDFADAFVVLPGGFGTLDELCEMVTWAQLGHHSKPIFLVNVENYWDSFMAFVKHCVQEGFIPQENLNLLRVVDSVTEVFDLM